MQGLALSVYANNYSQHDRAPCAKHGIGLAHYLDGPDPAGFFKKIHKNGSRMQNLHFRSKSIPSAFMSSVPGPLSSIMSRRRAATTFTSPWSSAIRPEYLVATKNAF